MGVYRDYLIAIISQSFNYIVPFTIIIYLSHIFPKEFIVLLFFSQALIQNFVTITDYGYAIRGSRIFALENDKKKLSEVAGRIYVTKFFLLVFSFFILFCIFCFSTYARSHLLFIVSHMGVLVANVIFPGWAFIGRKKFKFIYFNNLVSYILLLSLTFLWVDKTTPFVVVALIYSFSSLFPAIIGFLVLKKELNIEFSFRIQLIWRELREGFNIFLSSGIKGFYISIPLTILGITSNQYLLYNFSYPDKLVKLVISFYNFIMRLSLPFFLEKKTKKKTKELLVLLIFALAFIATLIYFKKYILMFVFNVKNVDYTYELLMISLLFKFIYLYLIYLYFFAYQKEFIVWKVFLIGLIALSIGMMFSAKMNISVGYSILFSDFLILYLLVKLWKKENL